MLKNNLILWNNIDYKNEIVVKNYWIVKKTDLLHKEYNTLHDRFTYLKYKGRQPNVGY